MSERRERVLKTILQKRNNIRIYQMNVLKHETEVIHFIPYRDGEPIERYSALLPPSFEDMKLKTMREKLGNIRFERAG